MNQLKSREKLVTPKLRPNTKEDTDEGFILYHGIMGSTVTSTGIYMFWVVISQRLL